MESKMHECDMCNKRFGVKSNLTRHMKLHAPKENSCGVCGRLFSTKPLLHDHMTIHQQPSIPLSKQGQARLQGSDAATAVAGAPNKAVDPTRLEPQQAEAAAELAGGEPRTGQLVIPMTQSFRWLLKNDVGWVVRQLAEFCQEGERSEQLEGHKEHMLDYVLEFPSVTCHRDKKLKNKAEVPAASNSEPQHDSSYASDTELPAAADSLLDESEVSVSTQLTTLGELTPSSSQAAAASQDFLPSSSASTSIQLEGWQRYWEQPPASTQALGIAPANIGWLKCDGTHGLYERASCYKNARGETAERKLLKEKMEFNPPPLPVSIRGALPSMLAFFTTPVFFWRPVGVMQARIRCPNTNCPAPPGEFLQKNGFGSYARQVCGMTHNYTLLTERLKCPHCQKVRQAAHGDDDDEEEEVQGRQQYLWLAYSAKILMSLAPVIRSMFPAVLCGKRAVDKGVLTLLSDRLDAVSVTKVQRLLQQGHDQWYMDRRDLYQSLLYEAHAADFLAAVRGILSFVKPTGTYTPPIPQAPLPSARMLRRAHLVMEMEKMPVYRHQILGVTGEILCIDGTRKILKKISGEGRGTMQSVTSVLNEWGQFVTTVVVPAESEVCHARMARGLVARFQRANAPAPKVLYADNHCCRDSGSSSLETVFSDWTQRGTVVRLDIRHWLHRWDSVVLKQSHSKYGAFMSAMAGAVLAYNRGDMMLLVQAVRGGTPELYASYSDEEMVGFLKPHQVKSYVRRITRGVEETASVVESILTDFKGPAGLDIDGIPLFKSAEAVYSHWATASKHLGCMQDPPGIELYVAVKTVVLNGVQLNKYRCRRGSDSLEGLHTHMYNAIPSKRCGIMPFQVYLISFAAQWNTHMESLRGAGGQGRKTTCMDPRQVQRMNQQAEVLFGKEHMPEPNAPLPHPEQHQHQDPDEEELLGVEYAQCQSTAFTARHYYAQRVEEEQSRQDEEEDPAATAVRAERTAEEEEEELADEGVAMEEEDPIDGICEQHVVLTQAVRVEEEDSPALQDVTASQRHLHLPGIKEVEALATLLLELTGDSNHHHHHHHIVPVHLRQRIVTAASSLHEHDRTAASFVKEYESRWGHTLFSRRLGPDAAENWAAQKTKLGWMKYPQEAQVTEDSRLLYLLIKMLRNRPPSKHFTSPSKVVSSVKAQYERIVVRVRDNPVLCGLSIALPNINNKSISSFFSREEKKANYVAMVQPEAEPHRTVLSEQPLPDAPALPSSPPPPDRRQTQLEQPQHTAGKRRGDKRRLDYEEPDPEAAPSKRPIQAQPAATTTATTPYIPPAVQAAPILLVVPAQPLAPSVQFAVSSCRQVFVPVLPPPALIPKRFPSYYRSGKPCGACKVPLCSGERKRYTPSKDKAAGSSQKIFTFCPATGKSTTSGFDGVVYTSFEQFKRVVDKELETRA